MNFAGGETETLRQGSFNIAFEQESQHRCQHVQSNSSGKCNGDLATFNKQWQLKLDSFEQLSQMTILPQETEEQIEIKRAFLRSSPKILWYNRHWFP